MKKVNSGNPSIKGECNGDDIKILTIEEVRKYGISVTPGKVVPLKTK